MARFGVEMDNIRKQESAKPAPKPTKVEQESREVQREVNVNNKLAKLIWR